MNSYSSYLANFFPGKKVQKISVDAGFTCPNRDGTIGINGCIYCRNDSFSPGYCNPAESVASQLEKGKVFFNRKYPEMQYIAYFQSYTGTYKKSPEELKQLYYEALNVKDVVGLVIGTRPDSIPDEVLEILEEINRNYPVFIELGAETSHDETLKLINRNHTWNDVENATKRIAAKGLHCGLHFIIGLPNETPEMAIQTVKKASSLPIETLKFHQLQVLKDTPLHRMIEKGLIKVPEISLEEYLLICKKIVKLIPSNIVIERFLAQAPPSLVIYPDWGIKNYQFMTKLAQILTS